MCKSDTSVKVLLAGDDAERAGEVARTLATGPILTAAQALTGNANALPIEHRNQLHAPKGLPRRAMTNAQHVVNVAIRIINIKQGDAG
jgi:hypothetical protein